MNEERPRILVVTRRWIRKNKWVDLLGEYHLELLVKLGAMPIMIPVVEGTLDCLEDYAQEMNGLLLVEGEDILPEKYNPPKENVRFLESSHPIKDEIEFALCRWALERHLPVLGICRGCQILNVISGGTLYCDVMKERNTTMPHIADMERYDSYRHGLTILPGTPLYRWYRRKHINATSYHHQGIKELAAPFRPMAYAEDGLLEGFYDPEEPFVIGLQFHPERMLKDYGGNERVFRAFVNAASMD